MKIAISLITHNDLYLLMPCLDTLFKSDLIDFEYKLFICDNNSNKELCEYISRLNCNKYIIFNSQNEGIVIPRIKNYNEIIKEDFDLLLELHADMLFPNIWLKPLLEIDDDNTIILEPHIFQPDRIVSLEQFMKKINHLYKDVIYNDCRQVHPWLLKLNKIDEIGGYYDNRFSPQQFEDDDLTYRVISNKFNIKSTSKSWVCHYGGLTRNLVLPSYREEHQKLFEIKYNIMFSEAIKLYKNHPAFR